MTKSAYTPNKSMVGAYLAAITLLVVVLIATIAPFGFMLLGVIFVIVAFGFTSFFLWKLVAATFRFLGSLPSKIATKKRLWMLNKSFPSAKVVPFPKKQA